MAENMISHYRFNPWREKDGTRVVAAEAAWREPLKWDRKAKEAGERPRVFCASLADVFEDWTGPIHHSDTSELWRCKDQEPNRWVRWPANGTTDFLPHELANYNAGMFRRLTLADVRRRLFETIDATPNLDWLLLTKRAENIMRFWPPLANSNMTVPLREMLIRKNVWPGVSVENQAAADERIPHLLAVPAAVRFLSVEPMLGPVDLSPWLNCHCKANGEHCTLCLTGGISWVIVGGESGPGARPCDVAWIRSIVKQCKAAGTACFVKQLGAITVDSSMCEPDGTPGVLLGIRDRKGGDISEFPADLRVREFPR